MVGEQQGIAICSQHFENEDYILPPSKGGLCRLKRNATPSLFKLTCKPFTYNATEEARCRIVMPEDNHPGRKRSMPQGTAVQSKKRKEILIKAKYLRSLRVWKYLISS